MNRTALLSLCALSTLVGGCDSVRHRAAFLENSIVFQPQAYPAGDWAVDRTIEDAWIDSTDGVHLHGWFAAPAGASRAVVLFTHGNGGNVTSRKHVIELFRDQMQATILVFDYRGYGRSEGTPTEAGVLEDARAARRWLATRTGVREGDIVVVGHSLGGGVAVDLAAKDGARALILEGTFTNLPDVAASFVPLLPVRAVMQTSLNSIAKIASYHGPLLQVHGDEDEIVPYRLGRALFQAANEPKQFVTVVGGDHNNLYTKSYVKALDRFLGELPRP